MLHSTHILQLHRHKGIYYYQALYISCSLVMLHATDFDICTASDRSFRASLSVPLVAHFCIVLLEILLLLDKQMTIKFNGMPTSHSIYPRRTHLDNNINVEGESACGIVIFSNRCYINN